MTTAEIIEAIKGLTVLELNDLVKACEEEFGVSAAAGVVVAAAGGAAEAAEEKGPHGAAPRRDAPHGDGGPATPGRGTFTGAATRASTGEAHRRYADAPPGGQPPPRPHAGAPA